MILGKRPFYFLALTLLPLFFFLQNPQRNETLHQISLTVSKPFFAVSEAVRETFLKTGEGLVNFFTLYRTHGELVERVQELEQQLVSYKELEKENERLRELLKFKKEIPGKTLAARVIARDAAPWRKTLVIDKGTTHGIKKMMAVVSAEGLVGRVIEAGPLSSRVILLPDPQSRVSVFFQGSRDEGIAEGDGSSWLRVTHINRESQAKVGEHVVSSGLGRVYPKGVQVGTVEMVGTEKNGLELFATVKPFVNFSKLEEVLCVALSPVDS